MADGLAGSFRPEWTLGSIGSIAFNPEQWYMLIGGPDYLRFLVPESLLPFSYGVKNGFRNGFDDLLHGGR
ncbi:hypothetical protein [Bifidobacterium sp. ESL0800]|uniref:hypothetical protein n=1 Tax=Bifidobacterium sp. ESL0800 TaxID=2983236 RepID=UPI0023F7CB99|nr:hypothetical protein [Bifidobacterium sp. ESL0800]WEV75006.1 hypothetical protein OZX75_04920 [Bifidobacterium sp. ESL0800]